MLVQDHFARSVNRYPDKVAISCRDASLTYSELDKLTNSMVRALNSEGANRGDFIPIFMDKSERAVVSILGVLKSDCAYVPLDIDSPKERLNSIFEVTTAPLVIVDTESRKLLSSLYAGQVPIRMFDIESIEQFDCSPVSYKNLSIDIAYVLFTSGSTGTPKGVMVHHGAITDYIAWCLKEYSISSDDSVANHAPLYFDNSTFDLYTALFSGATLHLVYRELNLFLPLLSSWLRDNNISVLFCVPSVLTLLLKTRRMRADALPNMRRIICAGEVLPPNVLRTWMLLFPHIVFSNMYGPTEITVDCTFFHFLEPPEEDCLSVPIGWARSNMELFVRTEDGAIHSPESVTGELLVRGLSVTYGYLGDRDKTDQSYIQNPFNDKYHDLLYCTGDSVRFDANSCCFYIGRQDNQIKHLGHRIELGEIESALTSINEVGEAVVVYKDLLVAVVSLIDDIAIELVRDALSMRVPSYMMPERFVLVSDLPRTANGKYDRSAIASDVWQDELS
jgi:D-alanine--poly(phosphoribitol) ligase subunit 1